MRFCRPGLNSIAFGGALLLSLGCIATATRAQDASALLTIGASGFQPSTLTVRAGVKIQLTVKNATGKAAEFESAELNREKVIPAGASATIYIGPLAAGTYSFFDDFNKSSKGQIIAK